MTLCFQEHSRNHKKVKKSSKRLKTIASILLRGLQHKMPADMLLSEAKDFELDVWISKQQRYNKNKIYSLHELHTDFMSKSKAHKRYKFGVKYFNY